jgi:serine/threonine protein phosphatase 1
MAASVDRLLAVGDIHGHLEPFEWLLAKAAAGPSDTLVVLGDYTNRGPSSSGVLERLIRLDQKLKLVLILGNHEEELLAAADDPQAYRRWLSMGGDAFLESYGPSTTLADIPAAHWKIIEKSLPYWECDGFFFTHANYDAQVPLAQQSAAALRWHSLHEQLPGPHMSGKIAIVGHTPDLSGSITDFGYLRCLDTGCGLGGCLTMMDVRSGQFWQSPEDPYREPY